MLYAKMVIQITKTNFEREVVKSKIPIVVDFFAGWCGPCQMMAPVFNDLSKEYDGKVVFAKVDTEKDSELAIDNSVQGIPCLIVFEKGKEIGRIVGYHAKETLKQKINAILGKE
jgi:thioredoxin 1